MLKQLGAAILLCFLAIAPLPAQNEAPIEAATNAAASGAATPNFARDRDLENADGQ